jgi:hypothetical protein
VVDFFVNVIEIEVRGEFQAAPDRRLFAAEIHPNLICNYIWALGTPARRKNSHRQIWIGQDCVHAFRQRQRITRVDVNVRSQDLVDRLFSADA